MRRIYGVITDRASASEFLNKLYEACMYVNEFTGDDGNVSIETSTFTNPIQMISDYTYLESMSIGARAEAMNSLSRAGIINEAISGSAEAKVFSDLTKGVVNVPTDAEVAKFADNLYLGVLPIGVDDGDGSAHLTRIKIYQFYTEEVVTTQEVETTNEETGETETSEVSTTETITHQTTFMLGKYNSNALAPAVAYELTTAYSGDVLVKLAWCTTSCPNTEQELKHVFSSLSICQYFAKVENAGHDSAYIKFEHGGGNHTDIVFGASGPVGGFLLHTMKTQINGSRYAITVFNNSDRTPLYSWSAGSGAWDVLDTAKSYAVNINASGYGRIISKEIYGSNDTPVVAMSALAPIFTPAIDDIADTAKWMPQGPYDYSYFDNSGHIAMEKGNNPSLIFLADHGIYLYDGEWDPSKWSTDGLETPDSDPIDMVNIKRPDPPTFAGASRFYAIFDCLDGLSQTGWMNTVEGGDAYDMRFFGTPTINADGSVTFINANSGYSGAWTPGIFGNSSGLNTSIMLVAFKANWQAWSTWDAYTPFPILFSYIPGDDIKSTFDNKGKDYYGMAHYTPQNNMMVFRQYDRYTTYMVQSGALTSDSLYLLAMSPEGSGTGLTIELYRLYDGGSSEAVSLSGSEYFPFGQNVYTTRFYLGGYPSNDSSWRASEMRIGTRRGAKTYSGSDWIGTPITVKFVALADANGQRWVDFNYKSQLIHDISERYTST